MKEFKGTKGKLRTGPKTGFYICVPQTEYQKILLEQTGYDKEFECWSVGGTGQVAIFPCDDYGKDTAKANADLFVVAHEMLEILMSLNNQNGIISELDYEKIDSVISRALHGN